MFDNLTLSCKNYSLLNPEMLIIMRWNMSDCSIEEAIEIINNCDESLNPDTKHFDVRNVQRIDDFGLVFNTFLFNPLMEHN